MTETPVAPAHRITAALLVACTVALLPGQQLSARPDIHLTSPEPGRETRNATRTLVVGGRTRTYHLHVPAGRHAGALPLVIALHGGGGSGLHMQRNYGFDELADREGFIVAYPDGTGRLRRIGLTWNAGTCCGYASDQQIDDVGFLRTMVAAIVREFPVDRSRVYVTGHSNGGMMAHRLAREAADLVAAAAPVAGATLDLGARPSRAVPLMHIHSVDDPRAAWDGSIHVGDAGRGASPDDAIRWWVQQNGCLATPTVGTPVSWTPPGGATPHTATRITYTGCRESADVVLLKLTGTGHAWPGRGPAQRTDHTGPLTKVIDATNEVWEFVRRFRRRQG
jgi:polyhydroxybutyrate depolymerase